MFFVVTDQRKTSTVRKVDAGRQQHRTARPERKRDAALVVSSYGGTPLPHPPEG